jgi:hypothetical protein
VAVVIGLDIVSHIARLAEGRLRAGRTGGLRPGSHCGGWRRGRSHQPTDAFCALRRSIGLYEDGVLVLMDSAAPS